MGNWHKNVTIFGPSQAGVAGALQAHERTKEGTLSFGSTSSPAS